MAAPPVVPVIPVAIHETVGKARVDGVFLHRLGALLVTVLAGGIRGTAVEDPRLHDEGATVGGPQHVANPSGEGSQAASLTDADSHDIKLSRGTISRAEESQALAIGRQPRRKVLTFLFGPALGRADLHGRRHGLPRLRQGLHVQGALPAVQIHTRARHGKKHEALVGGNLRVTDLGELRHVVKSKRMRRRTDRTRGQQRCNRRRPQRRDPANPETKTMNRTKYTHGDLGAEWVNRALNY